MKAEHREIIDRAKLHGYYPSTIAHELLERDLVNTVVTELRSVRVPFHLLKEDEQQEVIDRIAESVSEVTRVAISIIASRGAVSVPVDMKAIKVEAKTMTITAKVDGAEPNKHELTDAAGKLCLLVMAPSDYDEGLDDVPTATSTKCRCTLATSQRGCWAMAVKISCTSRLSHMSATPARQPSVPSRGT
jgi:S-DNA-T family DNA segregation ATPase FtsK/SpoIIIE